MSAVISAPFGNPAAVRAAQAANAAFRRARELGYSNVAAREFANEARRDITPLESPETAAVRIVHPRRGRFAGPTGDDAA
jgi:hypothetical protein